MSHGMGLENILPTLDYNGLKIKVSYWGRKELVS
jgi:hypothetical protein